MPRHPATHVALFAAVAGAIAVVLLTRRMFPVRVSGPSMQPALREGDFVAVARLRGAVRRGEVVVVRRQDGLEIVKRVARVGGEGVFLAGDNPAASTDSREFGAVAPEHIAGVARAIYWPPSRWRLL